MRTVIIRCQFRHCSDCQPVVGFFGISRFFKKPITTVFANWIHNATQKKWDFNRISTHASQSRCSGRSNPISKCLLLHSTWLQTSRAVWSNRDLHCDLTGRLFQGWGNGSPFLMLRHWKAASPAYVVTDTYVVTTATHAVGCCGDDVGGDVGLYVGVGWWCLDTQILYDDSQITVSLKDPISE